MNRVRRGAGGVSVCSAPLLSCIREVVTEGKIALSMSGWLTELGTCFSSRTPVFSQIRAGRILTSAVALWVYPSVFSAFLLPLLYLTPFSLLWSLSLMPTPAPTPPHTKEAARHTLTVLSSTHSMSDPPKAQVPEGILLAALGTKCLYLGWGWAQGEREPLEEGRSQNEDHRGLRDTCIWALSSLENCSFHLDSTYVALKGGRFL